MKSADFFFSVDLRRERCVAKLMLVGSLLLSFLVFLFLAILFETIDRSQ